MKSTCVWFYFCLCFNNFFKKSIVSFSITEPRSFSVMMYVAAVTNTLVVNLRYTLLMLYVAIYANVIAKSVVVRYGAMSAMAFLIVMPLILETRKCNAAIDSRFIIK